MSFENNIQKWVSIDNQIKPLQDEIKQLREKRNYVSNDICNYIKNNNLDNATIKISDGKLKFVNTKQNPPLTYKFINECLGKCIPDVNQVELIMNFIKEQREPKYSEDIKRFYNNN